MLCALGSQKSLRAGIAKSAPFPQRTYLALNGGPATEGIQRTHTANTGSANTPTSARMAPFKAMDLVSPGPWVSQISYPMGVIMSP